MQFVKSTKSSARAKRSRARIKSHSMYYTELWTYPYNRIASPLVQLSMGGTSPLTPKMSKRSRESLRWLFVRLGKGSKKKWLFFMVIKLNFCSDFELKVWSRFWSWCSGEIWKLKFDQYFAADVWSRLLSWILVKILKLGLIKILSSVEILMLGVDFEVNV